MDTGTKRNTADVTVLPLRSAAVLYIINEIWCQTSQIVTKSHPLQDGLQLSVNRRRADSTPLPCNSTCSSFIANSYEASSLPGIELHHSYWLATKLRPLSLLHCHLQTPLSDTTTPVITPSYPAHVLFPGNNVFTQADH